MGDKKDICRVFAIMKRFIATAQQHYIVQRLTSSVGTKWKGKIVSLKCGYIGRLSRENTMTSKEDSQIMNMYLNKTLKKITNVQKDMCRHKRI